MSTVIIRLETTVDAAGWIRHRDAHTDIGTAERIAGRRLDRRRNYAVIDGRVCESISWTQQCSGCNGAGCSECGHCGKRRLSQWAPIDGR